MLSGKPRQICAGKFDSMLTFVPSHDDLCQVPNVERTMLHAGAVVGEKSDLVD